MRPIPGTRGDRSPADAVSITLRSLTDDADPREGVRVACGPGADRLAGGVGAQPERHRRQLRPARRGPPRTAGGRSRRPTAYLVPYGAPSGRYEQDAQVHLHPPRAAQAEAREWPIRVVAGSRASGADAGSASARLTVQPYQDVETDLRPERATGRRRGKFAFAVRNLANAPIELEFSATDPEEKCKFAIKSAPRHRPARPPHRHRADREGAEADLGRAAARPPVHDHARTPGQRGDVISRQAVFRQRPWFAWWVPIAIVAALALGVAGYKLLQNPPTITVPDLDGQEPPRRCRSCSSTSACCSRHNPAATKIVAAKNEIGQDRQPEPGARVQALARARRWRSSSAWRRSRCRCRTSAASRSATRRRRSRRPASGRAGAAVGDGSRRR